jgi:uncharacterized protein
VSPPASGRIIARLLSSRRVAGPHRETTLLTADEIRQLLKLQPLEHEGGWFAETYRSGLMLPAGAPHALASAIYYLIEPGAFSALHRLGADEIFHFYLGDPVEMLQLGPGTGSRVLRLGIDLAAGARPQAVAPAGVWQGSRLVPGGRWALLGTTVAPAFDPSGFELACRADLQARWPAHSDLIASLTRG